MTDSEYERRAAEDRRKMAMAGTFVPAGLLIGMGVGWLFDALVPGLFIGLGVGILTMAVIRMRMG